MRMLLLIVCNLVWLVFLDCLMFLLMLFICSEGVCVWMCILLLIEFILIVLLLVLLMLSGVLIMFIFSEVLCGICMFRVVEFMVLLLF